MGTLWRGTTGDDVIGPDVVLTPGIVRRLKADGFPSTVDTIIGGDGNDSLSAGTDNDSADGGNGNDLVDGGEGNDTLKGSAGLDTILGGGGDDLVLGGTGNDSISGGDGDDRLVGNAASDTGSAGGADTMDGGAGADEIWGGTGADLLTGGDGDDVLSDHTQNAGRDGSFRVDGFSTSSADTMLGGAGNDNIVASGGGDVINGGDGLDTLTMIFAAQLTSVSFTFAATGAWTVRLGSGFLARTTATITEVESLFIAGGTFGDAMNASAATEAVVLLGLGSGDVLTGGAGDDQILGDDTTGTIPLQPAGNDTITGGLGADTLIGGEGADVFVYNSAAEGGDLITDFTTGVDKIRVLASGFGGGLAKGNLAADRFVEGVEATAATGQFLHSLSTGLLLWDADGTGDVEAVVIANIRPNIVLVAGDIVVA